MPYFNIIKQVAIFLGIQRITKTEWYLCRLVSPNRKYPTFLIGKIRRNENYLCLSGKIIVNEVEEDIPRVWDTEPYSRYYAGENRRKRSEKSTATARPSTTLQPPTSSFQTRRLPSLLPTPQPVQAQVKRR